MKCFVTFRLKPGLTIEEYERWFREVNVPAARTMRSINSYRVWKVIGALEGEPSYEILEEMELDDRAAFERELAELPEMVAMLEGWYARITDHLVVFADEIRQV